MSSADPIPAYAEGTFAAHTVAHRLPMILRGVLDELGESANDRRWAALAEGLRSGGPIDGTLLTPTTQYWQTKIESLEGLRFRDLSFFDLEFVFYHAINSICAELRPDFCPFASIRARALKQALPQIVQTMEQPGPFGLAEALLLSVGGNEADLSQLGPRPETSAAGFLENDLDDLIFRLRRSGVELVVLADNAGLELCRDFLLLAVLLEAGVERVVVQLKRRPMFVSDALVEDALATVSALARASGATGHYGQVLECALSDGRLNFVDPADWTEPRFMHQLSEPVCQQLETSAVVLAKGDLNYRRFFEDRAWPSDTSVARASVAQGMVAFGLRVLKSDCVVGLRPSLVAELDRTENDWRTSGAHAMIQRIDARVRA